MRPRILPAALALALAAIAPTAAPADAPPESTDSAGDRPEVRSGAPIFRFNGKDLSGFYTYLKEHKDEDPGASSPSGTG
jgi:hypothetical protein